MNVDKELDHLFLMYAEASDIGDKSTLQQIIEKAQTIEGSGATTWYSRALRCVDKKWFVASIFARKPVPKNLTRAFIRSALETPDASRNRAFIEPVLQTYGTAKTKDLVSEACESDDTFPAEAKEKAMYWADRSPRRIRGM